MCRYKGNNFFESFIKPFVTVCNLLINFDEKTFNVTKYCKDKMSCHGHACFLELSGLDKEKFLVKGCRQNGKHSRP